MRFPIRFLYAIIYLIFGITSCMFSFTEKICNEKNSWNFNIDDYLLGLGILLLISSFFFSFCKKINNDYHNINDEYHIINSNHNININVNYFMSIILLFCVNFVWFVSGVFIFYSNFECIKDNVYDIHGLKLLLIHLLKLIHLLVCYKK